MVGHNWIERLDREYYNSGKWKCPLSPTGGHHSICRHMDGIYICKYCFDVQKRPTTFLDAMKFQNKRIHEIQARRGKKKKGGEHGRDEAPDRV